VAQDEAKADGYGVAKDKMKALEWSMMAEKGPGGAMFNLGVTYNGGRRHYQ
jgi:TPR repeat protein